MTKKKELLVDILDQLTEIKDVLDQVLNNLIPQPKEGPELLNEEEPPVGGKFIEDVALNEEDLRTDDEWDH